MHSEYVEKLKSFANKIEGEFNHSAQTTTTLKGVAWSRVEIRIPHPYRTMYFIAFSGTNQAEVYSGFFAETKLSKNLVCTITQKDKLLSVFNALNKSKTKSGRASFDKKLSVLCNDKSFLHKLTSNYEIAKFLENNLILPNRFEVISNFNGYVKSLNEESVLMSINTNEWMVEEKKLMPMLDGFRMIVDQLA